MEHSLETQCSWLLMPQEQRLLAAWSFGITFVIWKVMDWVWPGGVRVTPREEEIGLDLAQVGERAYSESVS